MVFSSVVFLFFYLVIVMMIYYVSPMKVKNVILFISGLIFYAWGEPIYVVIMIVSTLIDYTAGRLMARFDDRKKLRTVLLIVSLVMNLGLLAVFKYSSLFITTFNGITGLNVYDPKLPLPIGISFYTFQSMSYTIDMYRRNIKVQKNFVSFAAYVMMFPQIVAGPIVRYEDVQREIDDRKVNVSTAADGIGIFIKGLAKKLLLANNIGLLWATVKAQDYGQMSVLMAWVGILAYTFQIYFDFSGYSDMAVGLGKMLGFNFPKNFDYPYMSRSISEFWRRWHITLGSWFKSYVYIPLGGNRRGLARTILNLLIVWTLTGFWHGASWNFLIWGFYFGVLIVIERLFLGKILEKIPSFFSWLYTFVLVVFGWVLFDTNTLGETFSYIGAMFGAGGKLADNASIYYLMTYGVTFALCIFASTNIFSKTVQKIREKKETLIIYAKPLAEAAVMIVCVASLVDATYNPFIYFRF